MNWLRRMFVHIYGHPNGTLPSVRLAILRSRKARQSVRPVIDRARMLADAFERGDSALRHK